MSGKKGIVREDDHVKAAGVCLTAAVGDHLQAYGLNSAMFHLEAVVMGTFIAILDLQKGENEEGGRLWDNFVTNCTNHLSRLLNDADSPLEEKP